VDILIAFVLAIAMAIVVEVWKERLLRRRYVRTTTNICRGRDLSSREPKRIRISIDILF
jgi:hypothetical protein